MTKLTVAVHNIAGAPEKVVTDKAVFRPSCEAPDKLMGQQFV